MKTLHGYWSILFILTAFLGCKEDEVAKQEEGRMFVPRIFGDELLFPDGSQVLDQGASIDFAGLQYSPADQVKVLWSLDDETVSTDKAYVFTATEPGDFRIKVEVSYNGITISRQTDVFVLAQSDNPFTPKPYDRVLLSYVGATGDVSSLNWDQLTHVAFKAGTVTSSGVLDVSSGVTGRKAEELVTRAHLKGVPVLLGISGALSTDGWNVYGSTDFGAALRNQTQMQAIAQSAADFISAYNMDGVDIMMADVGHDDANIISGNIGAIGGFLSQLRNLLGADATITVSVAANWVHSYYNSAQLSAANWVNVHAFAESGYWGANNPLGQPSSYDFMVNGANTWKAKLPASKLVIGIPAWGIRHLQVTADGKSAGWGNTYYDFIPYRDIVAQVPDAYNQDYTAAIAQGVYYNGVSTVTQKAQFVKDEGFLGVYLWAGDYDASSAEHSLTRAIAETLK